MSGDLTLPILDTIIKDVNNLRSESQRLSMRNFHILGFQHIENLMKILLREETGQISRSHYLGGLLIRIDDLYGGEVSMHLLGCVSNYDELSELFSTNFLDIRYAPELKDVDLAGRRTYLEVLYALIEICVYYRMS